MAARPATSPLLWGVLLATLLSPALALITDETQAAIWLAQYNAEAQIVYSRYMEAHWNYNTNITNYNQQKTIEEGSKRAAFKKDAATNASLFDWQNFQDQDLKRQFLKISVIGTAKLPTEKVEQVDRLNSDMETIYSTGEVCNATKCYPLDPDLTRIFTSSKSWAELEWAWKGWRDVSGKKMKDKYEEFVRLQNEAAVLNGYADQGAYWRSWYEMEGFEAEVARLMEQLKPLYQHLHAYIRRKLMDQYGADKFPSSGHIPAHLLGNMWGQTWSNLLSIVEPYPGYPSIDVTQALVQQNYTTKRIFTLAEDFFLSLGLEKMPDSFWNDSMLERPKDGRQVVCHASAWDFYNQKDFRIKQCTDNTMEWLITTHHEMGHIQYFLQYKNTSIEYRDGANPGFHEAVGDVMSLSVSTPEHLYKVGLLNSSSSNHEQDINYQMYQALDRLAFIPFGYLVDQWRWSVFSGRTPKEKYTQEWWTLRCKHQGLSPPVPRSEEDFDPGAKYHIPGNTPYIRYFVSYILQFQIQAALCKEANVTGPLHRCDIYQSRKAGEKLANMLKLGSSKPWPDALEQVTGTRQMDASAFLGYFAPLQQWLETQNAGHKIGWEEACPEGSIISSGGNQATLSWALCTSLILILATLLR